MPVPSGRLPTVAVAVVAGLALTAGLPPFGWWPLALAGCALLARLVAGRPWRSRVLVGLATGVGFLGPGLFWMTEFSAPGFVLAVIIESVLFTLGVVAFPADRLTVGRPWRWAAFPAALVLAEGLRGIWPFGGVPIATLAQTQIGGPLAPGVRLGGPLLLAALVAGVGAAAALAAGGRRRGAAATGIAVVAVVAAGWLAPHGSPVGPLDVAVVQGGGERGTLAVDTSAQDVYERHVEAMGDVGEVDLVLWPEDIVKVTGDVTEAPVSETIGSYARSLDATLVVGSAERLDDRFRVMSTVWSPEGEPISRFQKNQRVPFGEYVPFRPLIERVADVSPIPRDSLEGRETGIHRGTPAGDLGVAISFEVFFPPLTRAAVTEGAEVVLVPTNATSYSTTQMPALELGSARLRALETGRHVVQAAPTGFSAVVDPDGRVRQQTDLGARAVLEAAIQRRAGHTPYVRIGDLPFVAVALGALLAVWFVPQRERSTSRRPRNAAVDVGSAGR